MYWVVFDWIYFPILLTLCSDQFCFSFYSIQMSFCQKNCGPFRAQLGILLIYLKGGIRTPKINSKTHNLVVLSALRVAPVWYLPLVQFIYCKYIMTIRNSMSAGRFWVSPSVVFRSILDLRASRDPEYTKWPEWSHWVFFFFFFLFFCLLFRVPYLLHLLRRTLQRCFVKKTFCGLQKTSPDSVRLSRQQQNLHFWVNC